MITSADAESGGGEPAVEVSHLRKVYGDNVAVDNLSFTVNHGEIFGILGPNGAGKTTTVECVIGLRKADGGSIRVLGLDPDRQLEQVHQVVGTQLQASALPPRLKVGEILDEYHSFYRHPADPDELLTMLDLQSKRNAYYRSLSGGQRQRLSVALALVGQPKIAVLDEMTTGLDPKARRDTWELIEKIRDRGVTILLVSHYMDEVQRLCDRVALIDQGQLVALNTPEGLAEFVGGGKRVRFRSPKSFDDNLLTKLPEVTRVDRQGEHVVVTGQGELVNAIILSLDRNGIEPKDVQTESATLEDAFLNLTSQHERGEQHADGEQADGEQAVAAK